MSTTYNAITEQSAPERKVLRENKYSLQLAKSVASQGSKPSFNVVFKSHILGPHMSVKWTTVYGLNWTTTLPTPGALVTFTGDWQSCSLGSSYDLDQDGTWVARQKNPNANSKAVNVASNGYPVAVYIIVGVQDQATKEWSPIWIADNKLLKNSHGEYQPMQSINLWYQEGDKTSTMIHDQATPVQEYDMTTEPYYFSYDVDEGKWRTPQNTSFGLTALSDD
ncbi:splicing factor 3b [Fusarium coicis]|nr:splicing factor 3b [Fusarium coicis]